MITIEGLSKSFGKTQALKSVSLTLEPGVTGLLGPNGSGKTTLLRFLTGIYPDTKHTIRFEGKKIQALPAYKRHIGYLPQQFGLFPYLSVMDALHLLANLKELPESGITEEILRCLEQVALADRAYHKVKSLSGGMLRRVGIAQVLMGAPNLRFFDEPTSGLDPEERLRFKNLLSKKEVGVCSLLSTHIVEDIEAVCDRILVLKKGEIRFSGTQSELAEKATGWVYQVAAESFQELDTRIVLRRNTVGGESVIRYLSAEPGTGQVVTPTLEDGYMRLIHFGNA